MKSQKAQDTDTACQTDTSFLAIGIGASAGGQDALIKFFDHLSPGLNIAVIVVTHLLRNHKSILNQILAAHTLMPVIRIEQDILLKPGNVYVLTENRSVLLENGWLKCRTRDQAVVNQNIDLFLGSLGKAFKEKALGIILSGGGSDGLKGAQTISEYGGHVLVQDPETALVDGMPCSVIDHDHPSSILSPEDLARKVNDLRSTQPGAGLYAAR